MFIRLKFGENGNIVYTGKIKGEQAQFVVSNDNTVVFNYGDKSYGQFTMKEDPTAIPDKEDLAESMIGIEIRNGDNLLFRGGVLETGDDFWLFDEDGTLNYFDFSYNTEPSDWQVARRYIGWTVVTIMVLVIYIMGLY